MQGYNPFNKDTASGSVCRGDILSIYHRYHHCAKAGHWLITMFWHSWSTNLNAVMDDFGNLVPVGVRHG